MERSESGSAYSINNARRSWLWLLAAIPFLACANGLNSVPLAAWLAPAFLLRFVRMQRPAIGLPVAYVLLTAAMGFQFRGMIPIPGVWYVVFLMCFGITLVAPYVIDRFLSTRLSCIPRSLVFPSSWVLAEYLVSLSPFGTWGSAAYSQYGDLALLQVLSITGLEGVTFLIGWFAAVMNGLMEEGRSSQRAMVSASVCIGTIGLVVLVGGLRLSVYPPDAQTVRIASLSRPKLTTEVSNTLWEHAFTSGLSLEEQHQFQKWGDSVADTLFDQIRHEADAGARMVFWSEGGVWIEKEREAMLIERGKDLAANKKIYLGMSLCAIDWKPSVHVEIKLILIDPKGQVAWEYRKTQLVPGLEAATAIPGDGRLQVLETPYGRLSSIICFDADFPRLISQAGDVGADIVLNPSNDGRGIDPWHTQMASFRSIEQGFSQIRQTYEGLSAAYDYQGRTLAAVDDFATGSHVMISEVPTKGTRTLYGILGDWLVGACLIGLLLLTVQTYYARRGA